MSKLFVKKGELSLINGGYVVAGEKQTPVYNEEFIAAQIHAEWIITFAEKAKNKDFVGKEADDLADVILETMKALGDKEVKYVSAPKKVSTELTDKLKAEALNFINHDKETSKVNKINKFLQQFNVIKEFEEFGLYFEEDIVKLEKVYTIKEIVKAVESVIELVA